VGGAILHNVPLHRKLRTRLVEFPSRVAGAPVASARTSHRDDKNKRRFRNLKRVTDDVTGTTAVSDVPFEQWGLQYY
jgi:hypothetical protein